MKNLTISLDDETHLRSRVRAAHAGLSMSRYITALVEKDIAASPVDQDAEQRKRLQALERFISGPKFEISVDGKMPTAEERNARR